ncbi:MAG: hypothetical protein RIQ88_379 [Actinomycetota bacterium]|jgi:RHH-type rel operon transcriptional repressor/antitoxin RelB
MAMLTLRISDELNSRIEWMANHSGRSKSYFVKKMIEDAITDLEDQVLSEIALKKYLASTPEDKQLIPWEKVKAELREREMDSKPKSTSPKRAKQTTAATQKKSRRKN